MTPCEPWKEQLLDLALGAAPGVELERHLRRCPQCAAAVKRLSASAGELDRAVREVVRSDGPPPGFHARVMAGVAAPPVAARRWIPRAAWALAVLLLAIALIPWAGRRLQRTTAPDLAVAEKIARWESPTAGLLRSPAEQLLRTIPQFGQSAFEMPALSPSPARKKGGRIQ